MFYEGDEFVDSVQDPVDYLTADEVYEEALIKASKMYSKALSLADPREVLAVGEAIHHEATPLLLHFIMFIPALMGHASEEQLQRWLPDAIELKIIGTYAQTELGHGTYVRGLETKATYDQGKEQFVLESPNLKSIKWWPGGLGKTANYAIVLAQLFVKDVCHGVHPFMVQLRDMTSHKPLAGITVGEVGPKMGLKAADNGFLQLNAVRIPRQNMLNRNAQVTKDGTYTRQASEKMTYSTMVFVRVVLIDMVAFNVGRAVTIAVRYSAVRRQAEIERGKGEVQILDYKAQQYKLLPCLAAAHAFKAAYVALMSAYRDVSEDIELRGDHDRIGELHAMSSGLKALSSEIGSQAIERCRLSCGGQGYLLISGLPRLYATTVAACTYEGENTVLYLQTARYLLKTMSPDNKATPRNATSNVQYLRDDDDEEKVAPGDSLLSVSVLWQYIDNDHVQGILSLFRASAYRQLKSVQKRLLEDSRIMSPEKAWIESQIDLIKATKAHLMYYLLAKYCDWVELSPEVIRTVLRKLCLLYLYYNILESPGEHLLVGLKSDHLDVIGEKTRKVLQELRPDAVGLVDAFDFHDLVLMSALGCYDGAVYERLFDMAKRAPLNRHDVHPAFMKHIKSLTSSGKSKL